MKKTFDAVAFMRKRREEIDREDAALTWEQKREKTRRIVENDPLWAKLKTRVVQTSPQVLMAVREKQETDYGKPDSRSARDKVRKGHT
jgi:uncharacterized membrane protein